MAVDENAPHSCRLTASVGSHTPSNALVWTQRKIVVAGDFLNGSCWERRLAVQARDRLLGTKTFEQTTNLEALRTRREAREHPQS